MKDKPITEIAASRVSIITTQGMSQTTTTIESTPEKMLSVEVGVAVVIIKLKNSKGEITKTEVYYAPQHVVIE